MGGFGEMADSRLEAKKDQGEPEVPYATKDGCAQGWGSSQEAMSFAKSRMIWLSKQVTAETHWTWKEPVSPYWYWRRGGMGGKAFLYRTVTT